MGFPGSPFNTMGHWPGVELARAGPPQQSCVLGHQHMKTPEKRMFSSTHAPPLPAGGKHP